MKKKLLFQYLFQGLLLTLFVFFTLFIFSNYVSPKCKTKKDESKIDQEPHIFNKSLLGWEPLPAVYSDSVYADPNRSSAHSLASSLYWSRKKIKILQRALKQSITNQSSKMNISCPLANSRLQNNQLITSASNCNFIVIKSHDARFEEVEPGISSPRLDGIPQKLSISNKFHVELCTFGNNGLRGQFMIRKSIFYCSEDTFFSADPEYTLYVRSYLGPDEMSFTLEGPEIIDLVPNLQYLGSCSYLFEFEVKLPGRYHLNLIWNSENFRGAVDIASYGWLPKHYDLPLGYSVFLDFGSLKHSSSLIDTLGMTKCNLRDKSYNYVHGSWIYTDSDSLNMFHEPRSLTSDPAETIATRGADLRTVINISKYSWVARKCVLKKYNQESAARCLDGKRVLFHGDSHMRQLRNSLMLLVCGVALHVQVFGCLPSCPSADLSGICAVADGLGKDPTFMMREDVDLTVANFGHHIIDGERRLSIRNYQDQVDQLIQKLSKIRNSSLMSKLSWYESNAIPFGKNDWVIGYGDQRTNTKISIMNAYVNSRIRTLGIPIIPSFSPTISVHNVDGAHIDLEVLIESSAQFVLGLLCP
jgi:hypothetical protein